MINTPVNAINNTDPLEGINWNTQPDPTDAAIFFAKKQLMEWKPND